MRKVLVGNLRSETTPCPTVTETSRRADTAVAAIDCILCCRSVSMPRCSR